MSPSAPTTVRCSVPSHPHHAWPSTGAVLFFRCQRTCLFCSQDIPNGMMPRTHVLRCYSRPANIRDQTIKVLALGTGHAVDFDKDWDVSEEEKHTKAEYADRRNARKEAGIDPSDDTQPELEEPFLAGTVNGVGWRERKRSLEGFGQQGERLPAREEQTTADVEGDGNIYPLPHDNRAEDSSRPYFVRWAEKTQE
ncbi:hypothetical protein EJ05DRAFT_501119 [Pseudovirgaria hyperparasitica]|uniref:Uncharacterized protein n=1 Tax=Pseudovirgaria hyperparasitica TaxID=470096 RepID=A0A6A6W3S3_9PEZI|nr:uncharacterized protein EJ05DRAFT_501119 [Pseudovirgaria hyperparasitica]KAF2757588.1 hypothetical protein EJ05DRAFT_501119 [Pseudovirgaria hyperparasitica]